MLNFLLALLHLLLDSPRALWFLIGALAGLGLQVAIFLYNLRAFCGGLVTAIGNALVRPERRTS